MPKASNPDRRVFFIALTLPDVVVTALPSPRPRCERNLKGGTPLRPPLKHLNLTVASMLANAEGCVSHATTEHRYRPEKLSSPCAL